MIQNDQLILQAIESAERSLGVAKQLLGGEAAPAVAGQTPSKFSQLLGEVGTFDGENLIAESGRKYQVPPNYASKSLLVVGDTLRMVEGNDGVKRFKQIQKVPRFKVSGILTKKDGAWSVVTEEGSFKALPASVKHFEGEIGDEASVLIPKDYKRLRAGWVALEEVLSKKESAPPAQEKRFEAPLKIEEKKESPKVPPRPFSRRPKEAEKPTSQVKTEEPKKETEQKITSTKKLVGKVPPKPPPEVVEVVAKPESEPKPGLKPKEPEIKGEIKVEEEELR